MFIFFLQSLLFVLSMDSVDAMGCMATICSADPDARQPVNRIIKCSSDGICGDYGALRRNDQMIKAVDLSCREGSAIYAPFDGELSPWRPFGENVKNQGECKPNQGARIDGHGQWQGFNVLLSSVRLFRYSGTVRAGQKIGIALNMECVYENSKHKRPRGNENFIRTYLFRENRIIDPTHHLIDCMCTGQICETNRINTFEGLPFKFDSRFNGVRGWEIKCPDLQPSEGVSSEQLMELADESDNEGNSVPKVFSPIEGEAIGRIRLNSEPGSQSYSGCSNEGIFIIGTGKWTDYEVRIYNARFRETLGLGNQHIEQGQYIGHRLDCPDENISPTVFIEVRFQGVLLDITDAITAKNCMHKNLRHPFN